MLYLNQSDRGSSKIFFTLKSLCNLCQQLYTLWFNTGWESVKQGTVPANKNFVEIPLWGAWCSASAGNGNQAIAASLVSEQLIALEERTIEFSRSRFLAARAASSFMSRALNISSSFPFNLSSGVM